MKYRAIAKLALLCSFTFLILGTHAFAGPTGNGQSPGILKTTINYWIPNSVPKVRPDSAPALGSGTLDQAGRAVNAHVNERIKALDSTESPGNQVGDSTNQNNKQFKCLDSNSIETSNPADCDPGYSPRADASDYMEPEQDNSCFGEDCSFEKPVGENLTG